MSSERTSPEARLLAADRLEECGFPELAAEIRGPQESDWIPVSRELPPEGHLVETKIDDHHGERNVGKLRRQGRLWFAGGMYVYYEPTHWRVPGPSVQEQAR